MVHAIHTSVKGRARYKVKGLYRSESLKKHIEFRLSEKEGISHFSVNAITSNILIFFNSNNNTHTIASVIEGIVIEHETSNPPSPPLRAMAFNKGGMGGLLAVGGNGNLLRDLNKRQGAAENIQIKSRRKLRRGISSG